MYDQVYVDNMYYMEEQFFYEIDWILNNRKDATVETKKYMLTTKEESIRLSAYFIFLQALIYNSIIYVNKETILNSRLKRKF